MATFFYVGCIYILTSIVAYESLTWLLRLSTSTDRLLAIIASLIITTVIFALVMFAWWIDLYDEDDDEEEEDTEAV